MKIYKIAAFDIDREKLMNDLHEQIAVLREKGRMIDTSIAEGMRSGVMMLDRKSRMIVKDIFSIIDMLEIPATTLPEDIQDWMNVNGEIGRARIAKMFDPDGNRT